MDAPLALRPPLERMQLAADDSRWLPLPVRAAGSLAGALVFAVVLGLVIAAVVVLWVYLHVIWFGVFALSLVPAAYRWRNVVAQSAMRRRMSRLRQSAAYLPSGPDAGAGELVRVRGRIRAISTIPALLGERRVVFRRLVFGVYNLAAVHESAVDFLLDDGSGEPVLILVEHARIIADDAEPERYAPLAPETVALLETLDGPGQVEEYFHDWRIDVELRGAANVPPVAGSERVLRDGDTVEVVGHRCRVIDQTVTARLERDTPFRAALKGSATMPLLIAPD